MEKLSPEKISKINQNEKEIENIDNNEININDITNDQKNPKEDKEEPEIDLKSKFCYKLGKAELIKKATLFSLKNWKFIICNILQTFIDQFFTVYLPIGKKSIIDSITKKKNSSILYSNFKSYSLYLIFKLISIEILQIFSYYFISDSKNSYDNILLSSISNKDMLFFDIFKTAELSERIERSESCIERNFIFQTIILIQYITKFLFISYYLINSSPLLTLIYIVIFILKFSLEYFSKRLSLTLTTSKINRGKDRFKTKLLEFISNIRLIKSFTKEDSEVKKLISLKLKFKNQPFGLVQFFKRFVNFINEGSDSIILYIAGINAIKGNISYGDLTLFQTYSRQLKLSLTKIQSLIFEYENIYEGWRQFFEVYDFKSTITSIKNIKPNNLKGAISFKNVSFSYPIKTSSIILKQLSFKINPGKRIAIMGYSGGGKTTISYLLQRFYAPNEGDIYIDNFNIKDLNVPFLRKQISIVEQEPVLYSGTIKDNITFGVNGKVDEEKFKSVCKLANVCKFAEDKALFPQGYMTIVGERGVKVSGGQKQRIAIARALMKNAKILIFDEATSALDAESESEVQLAIDNIIKTKNITTIIIAHRLCTIKNADWIFFLSKGKVIEEGTHEDLIKTDGEYKKLVQKQLI